MKKTTYELDFLSRAGPYSHLVEAGGFIFVSGMVPVDVANNVRITDETDRATEVCLNNIKRALEHAGSGLDRVVKVTVFLRDMATFDDMNRVYRTFFAERPPARTCVAVRELPGNFPIEIEAIAVK